MSEGIVWFAKFGIFKMTRTKARQGRNPATGQPITIPAGYRIGFKVSKTWKDSMMLRKRSQEQKAAKPAATAEPALSPTVRPTTDNRIRSVVSVVGRWCRSVRRS